MDCSPEVSNDCAVNNLAVPNESYTQPKRTQKAPFSGRPASPDQPPHRISTLTLLQFQRVRIDQPTCHAPVRARHEPAEIPGTTSVTHGNGRPDTHQRVRATHE